MPLKALEHNQLAMLCSQLHMPSQSIKQYKMAIKLDPNNHEHYYSLAAVLRHTGDMEQAEFNLNKAATLNPMDIDAITLKVDLKKQTSEHNDISRLSELLTKQLSPKKQVQLQFALAKSLEVNQVNTANS